MGLAMAIDRVNALEVQSIRMSRLSPMQSKAKPSQALGSHQQYTAGSIRQGRTPEVEGREQQPCRTAGVSFMVARARGRARPHGAAHAGGPRAQQAGKLETRPLFARSEGGTIAPPGGNSCAPRAVRLDLRPPSSRGRCEAR
jgi:hypothetical protein